MERGWDWSTIDAMVVVESWFGKVVKFADVASKTPVPASFARAQGLPHIDTPSS